MSVYYRSRAANLCLEYLKTESILVLAKPDQAERQQVPRLQHEESMPYIITKDVEVLILMIKSWWWQEILTSHFVE